MATIASLPPELIENVASHLHDADDLLSLRLTNTGWNVAVRTSHLKALYESMNICRTACSLENLVKISKHQSGVNKLVRNIKVFYHTPYIHNPPSLKRDGRRGDEEGFDLAYAVYKASRNRLYHTPIRSRKSGNRARKIPVFDEQMEMNLLTTAFCNFPNLQTLELDTDSPYPFSRTQFNLYFPSLRMEYGKHIPASFRKAQLAAKGILEYTYTPHADYNLTPPFTALVLSGCSKVRTIRQVYDGILGMHMDWFLRSENQVTKLTPLCASLKILELTVVTPDFPDEMNSGANNNKGFYSWVETAGQKLEQLKITFQHYNLYTDRDYDLYAMILDLPTTLKLPSLKRLHIDWMVLTIDRMIDFLQSVAGTLEELELGFCLAKNPKYDWWRLLRVLNSGFDKMQKFSLFVTQESVSPQEFHLPDILVTGNWALQDAIWTVRTPTFPSGIEYGSSHHSRAGVEASKRIGEELMKHTEEDSFWESITEGNWKADNIVNWMWPGPQLIAMKGPEKGVSLGSFD
ncbi:hypothetical protein AA313_de0206873 [Arthrobotrys entomopaga]|nr:hypothetical protein AA313_de0206873 [Arthrobotrys entomopaga]